jgi:hypothetical protein
LISPRLSVLIFPFALAFVLVFDPFAGPTKLLIALVAGEGRGTDSLLKASFGFTDEDKEQNEIKD